ncbi:MAG: zinc-ribbon domain-containing protein, partial [Bacteroidota bacterium]
MTIECTACHARYTIADSLVPPQGARVRCRKCNAVFTVKAPGPVVSPEPLPVVPPAPEAPHAPHAAPE